MFFASVAIDRANDAVSGARCELLLMCKQNMERKTNGNFDAHYLDADSGGVVRSS